MIYSVFLLVAIPKSSLNLILSVKCFTETRIGNWKTLNTCKVSSSGFEHLFATALKNILQTFNVATL